MDEEPDLCCSDPCAGSSAVFRRARSTQQQGSGLQATVDFGDGITETLPLDTDHDYLYDVGNYVVHLQVKDGAIAFLDSQCPHHVCEHWLAGQGRRMGCMRPCRGVCGSGNYS